MKRKWVFIVIGLLLVAGIGGKVYIDKRAEQKEAEKIEAERMSVIALKKRYANIKSVEIKKSGYDKMTGAHTMFVKMTIDNDKSVSFSYTFWEKKKKIGLADLIDKEIQVKGLTTNKVNVIYSNNEEVKCDVD